MQLKPLAVIAVLSLVIASLSIVGCTTSTNNSTSTPIPSSDVVEAISSTDESFTSMALLNYPAGQDLIVNKTETVTVRVVNHENASANYRLVGTLTNKTVYDMSFRLSNNQGWQRSIAVTPTQSGMGQKLEFDLYKDGNASVYRSVYLYINVISLI